MTNQQRINIIRERLTKALNPSQLEIVDESPHHMGHTGATTGAGHFAVAIASPAFAEKTLVEKQRLVYKILNDMIPDEIHALRLKTK